MNAADYMSDELYYDNSISDSESDYDSQEESVIFDMKEHFRSLEMNRIRLLIQGKYELEEGEILTAFESISDEEQIACELAITYIRILDEFKKSSDLSEFILDTVDNLKLNSAQALKIHDVLMNEII
jgi:hypothetical protein